MGVERQEQDCRKVAEQKKHEVVAVYIDNDVSASTNSKKPRPEYNAMLEAVKSGEVDVIIAYSNSRLTRRPAEWIDLINLANEGKLTIHTAKSGDHDLTTADGRAVALTVAAWDAAEAERTSERAQRAARQRAELGTVKKGRYRTFGYTDEFQVIEEEAEVIRNAFQRVILGESVQSIADHWRGSGVDMGNGNRIHHSTVKNIVSRPLYAGLSVYKGEVVGRANVEPIVDEEVFNAAQAVLSDAGKPRGKNARRYLLSGLVGCSECLMGMTGNPGRKSATQGVKHMYNCKKVLGGCGTQSVDGVRLEAMALAVVRQRLGVERSSKQLKQPKKDLKTLLQAVERDIELVKKAVKNGDIDVPDGLDMMNGLSSQRRALMRELSEQVIEQHASVLETWQEFCEGSLSEQKATVARIIRRIVVKPAGGKQWNPDRVTFYLDNNIVSGGAVERQMPYVEPRAIVAGFRDEPELLSTVGSKPKKTMPVKGADGKFVGSRPTP